MILDLLGMFGEFLKSALRLRFRNAEPVERFLDDNHGHLGSHGFRQRQSIRYPMLRELRPVCWNENMPVQAPTLCSILWQAVAAIGPHLSPALVDRAPAIIYTLVVFPFLTEAFLASEFFGLIRWHNCAHWLTGVGLANHLGTDIDGSQRGNHQGDCECLIQRRPAGLKG